MKSRFVSPSSIVLVFLLGCGAFAQGVATNPRPKNEATGVAITPVLSWTPGRFVAEYAAGQHGNGHHVFFHTNQSWVSDGVLNYPLGTQFGHFRADTDSWSSADPVLGTGTALDVDTVYYWKVVEVNEAHLDSPWAGEMWTFRTIGPKAANPRPADGETAVALDVTVTWTPGTEVAYSPNGGHDVYFGTNQSDVTNASPGTPLGVYVGRQDANEYSPGGLDMETSYYWRIDEVNNASGTVTGDVWSSTTAGYTAANPSPEDGLLVGELYDSSVDVSLSWKAGAHAAETLGHDVYFGTNFDEVNELSSTDPDPNDVYKDRQSGASYELSGLGLDATYFWRIDEVNSVHPDGMWKGEVWSFTASSGVVFYPSPGDGEKQVSIEKILSWSAGYGATSHDVYFGTVSPPPFIGNQNQETYDPGRMQKGTRYYWRIDEHNVTGAQQGNICTFMTTNQTPTYPGQVGVVAKPYFVDWAKEITNYNTTNLDANGWPQVDFTIFQDLRLVAEWAEGIDDPEAYRPDYSGTYKCSFTGQASISRTWGVGTIQNVQYNSGTNTTTFDLVLPTPAAGQMMNLQFSNTRRTAASPTNSGITNLKIMKPGYAWDTTQTFTDDFLKTFNSVKFRCWRDATWSAHPYPDVQEWSERKRADECPAAWTGVSDGKLESMPWEYVIQFSNETGVSPWVSVPISSTDDYLYQLAAYLDNNLDPNMDFFLELSNEVWNTGDSEVGVWNQDDAAARGLTGYENYGRRVTEMAQIFETVLGAGSLHNRVKVILAGHHVCLMGCYPNNLVESLNYIDDTFGPPKNYIYTIATAPYFTASPVISTGTVDELLDACVDNLTDDMALRQEWINVANSWQLPGGACTYEAGFHTPCCSNLTNLNNQITMHRVPRAYEVLKYNYDETWFGLGAAMANHFTLSGAAHRYGFWGATDDVKYPDRNFKLQAVRQIVGDLTCDYNDDGIVNFADYAQLASEWGGSGVTDLNGDRTVDSDDLLKLMLDWMWSE